MGARHPACFTCALSPTRDAVGPDLSHSATALHTGSRSTLALGSEIHRNAAVNIERLGEHLVPELHVYPSVLSLAAWIAAATSAVAGVLFAVALVMIASGVVLAWSCA